MIYFMAARYLQYTQSGHLFIRAGDDLDWLVDAMLYTNYNEEFCLAMDFDPPFVAALMAAGFLVMSMDFEGPGGADDSGEAEEPTAPQESAAPGRSATPVQDSPSRYLLLPKLHLGRSVLFWEDLHESRTARRLLNRYELRFDTDFDFILERCAAVHGEDWLTRPLRESIRQIRKDAGRSLRGARPVSFGVYRDGVLRAGEFGVIVGGVYTSYSGYRDEDSAGTAQLILTGRWLRDKGFAFWDLGMPLDYKDRLGARNVTPGQFVELFRKGKSRADIQKYRNV
jgi:Leu/Phe-tRNA-protein transferase